MQHFFFTRQSVWFEQQSTLGNNNNTQETLEVQVLLACLSHLKTARPGPTHTLFSLSRLCQEKSACMCLYVCVSANLREKKGEVRLHENAKKGSRRLQTKKRCVSLCFQIMWLWLQCFSFRPLCELQSDLLVRVSPVGVTREVPVNQNKEHDLLQTHCYYYYY